MHPSNDLDQLKSGAWLAMLEIGAAMQRRRSMAGYDRVQRARLDRAARSSASALPNANSNDEPLPILVPVLHPPAGANPSTPPLTLPPAPAPGSAVGSPMVVPPSPPSPASEPPSHPASHGPASQHFMQQGTEPSAPSL